MRQALMELWFMTVNMCQTMAITSSMHAKE